MKKDRIIGLNRPEETGSDVLTEIIGKGAQRILKEALEIEIESFIDEYRNPTTREGTQRVVGNGYLPAREIVAGVGGVLGKPREREIANQATSRESSIFLLAFYRPVSGKQRAWKN